MEAEGVVEPLHELERQHPDAVADAAGSHRADLFGLRLGINPQPCDCGLDENLERQYPVGVRGQRHHGDDAASGDADRSIGRVIADNDRRPPPGGDRMRLVLCP